MRRRKRRSSVGARGATEGGGTVAVMSAFHQLVLVWAGIEFAARGCVVVETSFRYGPAGGGYPDDGCMAGGGALG